MWLQKAPCFHCGATAANDGVRAIRCRQSRCKAYPCQESYSDLAESIIVPPGYGRLAGRGPREREPRFVADVLRAIPLRAHVTVGTRLGQGIIV
jgi:hypothetical protein